MAEDMTNVTDVAATFPAVLATARKLKRRLQTLKEQIRDIRDQGIRSQADPSAIPLFKGMLRTVDRYMDQAEKIWDELKDLDEEEGELIIQDDDRVLWNNIRRYFHEVGSVAESFPSTSRTSSLGGSVVNYVSGPSARNSLPVIPIPKFDGQLLKWRQFRDTFDSLINNDPKLTDADKFHYLAGALQGPAAAVIASLPHTARNYQIAWKALSDNYDNPRLIASAYLDRIIELKPLTSKPSAAALRLLVAQLTESVAAFKTFEIPDTTEFLFFYLAKRCLDPATREAFEWEFAQTPFPTFQDLMGFLKKRCDVQELTSGVKLEPEAKLRTPFPDTKAHRVRPQQNKGFLVQSLTANAKSTVSPKAQSSTSASPSFQQKCFICSEVHSLWKCDRFGAMTVSERLSALKDWKGCRCCLGPGHTLSKCNSKWRCRTCRGKHHSLLHQESSDKSVVALNADVFHTRQFNGRRLSSYVPRRGLLGSALGYIPLATEGKKEVRMVLDCGSHVSFMTRVCAERCGLSVKPAAIDIRGIANTPMSGFRGYTSCRVMTQNDAVNSFHVDVVVVDEIMPVQPPSRLPKKYYEPYLGYELADPKFFHPQPVEFLLGCDLFPYILTGEVITLSRPMPRLIGTVFGFVVMGQFDNLPTIHSNLATQIADEALNMDLQRFWSLEEVAKAPLCSPEDACAEKIFQETHYRLPTGRYVVRIPFRNKHPEFPGHRYAALRRLQHLEAKLERSPEYRCLYKAFLQEYSDLGHMKLASSPAKYIIPHHGVFKGEPLKVRVVFDASSRCTYGSLNDSLYVGPKLQNDLANVLLCFRAYAIVFSADIVKMYRQILVDPQDRAFQHILWRESPSDAVQEFELSTVTYGLSCAPFLALRVIRQLVCDEGASFPLAAKALTSDIYIDDVVTGANTINEALELQKQIVQLLAKAEMPLGKWASNSEKVLLAIPGCRDSATGTTPQTTVSMDFEPERLVKVLGLQWVPTSDVFCYTLRLPEPVYTKRGTLSIMAKIYDPLGFLAPIVVLAKLWVQEAWRHELSWDDELPHPLKEKWSAFLNELPSVESIAIPRWVSSSSALSTKLLIFADASQVAYCATAFLRVRAAGKIKSFLLKAKTRLAPLKTVTIPRLELCAAVLACQVLESLKGFLDRVPITSPYQMFTDSTVVLGWLRRPHEKLPTFVANRVASILEITSVDRWFHVSSPDNPSDIGSRGVMPSQLSLSSLWFQGPPWLVRPSRTWPVRPAVAMNEAGSDSPCVSAIVPPATVDVKMSSIQEWMYRFSSFSALIKSMAWVLRFVNNVRVPILDRLTGKISVEEFRRSTDRCCRLTQAAVYFEGKFPQPGQNTPPSLQALSPFVCELGLLRVGGRLRNAPLSHGQKHPILIPPKSHLASLILRYYHRVYLHPGPTLLMAVVQTRYWIPGLRGLARQVFRTCVNCRRHDAPAVRPNMGDLPSSRFFCERPFFRVGVDYAGPFLTRESLRRKASSDKSYMCIFVCLATKAVHIEAVSSLSTPAFLAALERFIGRRGMPAEILSDNGSNFLGAARHLGEMHRWVAQASVKDDVEHFSIAKQIHWTFVPPHAPHFGGLWEAAVKSAKRLLRSVYGEARLTFEEFATVLIRVEAVLNSRPLCPLSCLPDDFNYLSPGHFLIGSSLLAPPEHSLEESKMSVLKRWQVVQLISQHFWKRWRMEYLATLQLRTKWLRKQPNLCVGDLVLLKDDRVERLQWPRGRITEVFPGDDGVVRVASVKTQYSTFRRPATQLIPLLSQSSTDKENRENH